MPRPTAELQRQYQREWMRKRRARYLAGRDCEWCHATEDLQIHHRDPNTKKDHAIWSWKPERREAELAKCMVLCGRCHRKAHGQARRVEAELRNPHGTYRRYRLGCRCDLCRLANAEYERGRKARVAA